MRAVHVPPRPPKRVGGRIAPWTAGGDRRQWPPHRETPMSKEDLEAWEDAAAAAGDAATMLIAGIARGGPARGLNSMTAKEIEENWPRVLEGSSGEEIAALVRDPARAMAIADSWGDPYPED